MNNYVWKSKQTKNRVR